MAETATLDVRPLRLRVSGPALIAVCSFAAALALGNDMLRDPDTLWHIVTGNWILAHASVPHADFYSYTMAGAPWVAHEWLSEVVLACAYDLGGWYGAVILGAACVATAMGLFAHALRRSLEPAQVVLAVLLAWLMLVHHMLARPHLLALPLLVLWLTRLVEARDRGEVPALAWALLIVPWANLHGSFLFGLGFAGMLAAEAVLTARDARGRWEAAWRWGRFLAVAALLPLAGPNGLEVYLLPLRLMGMTYTLSILVEWNSPDFNGQAPLELWLILAVLVGFVARLRLPISRTLMVLLLLHMALKHERHGELLGFGAALLIAQSLGAQLRERRLGANAPPPDAAVSTPPAPARRAGAALAGLVVLAAAALAAARPLAPSGYLMPSAALQAVRDRHVTGNVFNVDSFGGYLIWEGIPTFVDGRADMFGDAFVKREHKAIILGSDELPALLDEYHASWTIFHAQTRAVVLLDHLPGWQRLYSDDFAVIHVRSSALAAH
jgi:hypothetical protein